jgi:hypothetical protein
MRHTFSDEIFQNISVFYFLVLSIFKRLLENSFLIFNWMFLYFFFLQSKEGT